MSLRNWNRNNSFNFTLIASLTIVTAGMLLAVKWPDISRAQSSYIDRLVGNADKQNSAIFKNLLLNTASIIGPNDPLATESLAANYLLAGDYESTINSYESAILPINNIYMGNLSLRASRVDLANLYFSRADQEGESAQSQAGLAMVAFAKADVGTGCNYADRASKLNLSSPAAEQANIICDVLNGKSKLAVSTQGYLLINNYIFDEGLKKLESLSEKSSQDWLYIAKVYANRGEASQAKQALKNSLEINPANKQSLELMVKLLINSDRAGEATPYNEKLNELRFDNFK